MFNGMVITEGHIQRQEVTNFPIMISTNVSLLCRTICR